MPNKMAPTKIRTAPKMNTFLKISPLTYLCKIFKFTAIDIPIGISNAINKGVDMPIVAKTEYIKH